MTAIPSAASSRSSWALITANFANYDSVREPPNVPDVDCVLVTDSRSVARRSARMGWRVVSVPHSSDPWLASRAAKFRPYEYTTRESSIWIDARALFHGSRLLDWAASSVADSDLALYRHPERKSIAEEAAECRRVGVATDAIFDQVRSYRAEGFPVDEMPLAAGMLIVRRHSPGIVRFGEVWSSETERWRTRDQISLPYAIWKSEARVTLLEGSPYELEAVTFGPHRRPRPNETSMQVVLRRLKFGALSRSRPERRP